MLRYDRDLVARYLSEPKGRGQASHASPETVSAEVADTPWQSSPDHDDVCISHLRRGLRAKYGDRRGGGREDLC